MPLNRLRLTVDQPFHSWCQSPFLSHRRFCEQTNRFRPCCRCKFRQSIHLLLHRPSLSLRRFVHDMSFLLLPNPLAAPRGNGSNRLCFFLSKLLITNRHVWSVLVSYLSQSAVDPKCIQQDHVDFIQPQCRPSTTDSRKLLGCCCCCCSHQYV